MQTSIVTIHVIAFLTTISSIFSTRHLLILSSIEFSIGHWILVSNFIEHLCNTPCVRQCKTYLRFKATNLRIQNKPNRRITVCSLFPSVIICLLLTQFKRFKVNDGRYSKDSDEFLKRVLKTFESKVWSRPSNTHGKRWTVSIVMKYLLKSQNYKFNLLSNYFEMISLASSFQSVINNIKFNEFF